MAEWQQALPGVLMWPDSCDVCAISGPDGMLIVDAGTGEWIDHVGELPDRPVALGQVAEAIVTVGGPAW